MSTLGKYLLGTVASEAGTEELNSTVLRTTAINILI